LAEKKKRIHNLAKELDVTSKAIIAKCEAEGITVKNHMAVVTAGLEATIREWFSEGSHDTTLEEAGRVDLKRVKRKRRKKTTTKTEGEGGTATLTETETDTETSGDDESDESADSATVEAATSQPAETAPAAPAEPAPVAAEAPAAPEAPAAEQEPETAPETPQVAASAPAAETPAAEAPAPTDEPSAEEPPAEEPPAAPDAVEVQGPQNIPKPAALKGPKVIRIDKPERVERPRPARSGPRPPARDTGPMPPAGDEDRNKRRGPGVVPAADRKETASRSPRHRGRRDNREMTDEKFREWKERGVEEMRERIARATGHGISSMRAVERRGGGRRSKQKQVTVKKDKIEMAEPINIRDLSRESGIPVMSILTFLRREHEINTTINATISAEHAQLVCLEYGIELTTIEAKTMLDVLAEEHAAIDRKRMAPRPPIVTVLGHVDHGKTSLLDRIRKAKVAESEAGGITQHVGAYQVDVDGSPVTFLDTPGHAAFTAMRARGAHLTDVVVLVVAADDGVMPTTLEAINHAKAAETTIVVALNKCDLPHDINKIYGQLTEQGLTPSGDWGGEIDVIPTSAITGQGVDDLLAHLATLTEVLDLQADPSIAPTGVVIEARRDEKIGIVATVMVREGTLKSGQTIVCGPGYGRIRSMKNDEGKEMKKAGPATPVVVTGLSEVPDAGDKFFEVRNNRKAKEVAEEVAKIRREKELAEIGPKPTSLERMFAEAAEGEVPELNLIIRADAQGSVDALKQELSKFKSDEVRLNILHGGVGTVSESDITLAQASDALIVAFYVAVDPITQRKAEHAGVDIRSYRVLYEVSDDIKKALEGMLAPEERIESRGQAEVREVFSISKVGKIAGCFVRDGFINRNHKVRVVRDGVIVVDTANLDSLRRFKDDVKEVKSGFECGIRIERFDDLKPGDVIEALEVVEIARTL